MNKVPAFLNKKLLKSESYLAGEWFSGADKRHLTVKNPANGEVIGQVHTVNRSEVKIAIDKANEAQAKWRYSLAKDRAVILQKIAKFLVDNKDDLALLMTLEQGKPLSEAVTEILYSASYFEWFAGEARRIYGDIVPTNGTDRKLLVVKEPIGVVGVITPWNFPSSMIARKLSAALAAGCSMIIKPAEKTPLSALIYGVIADEIGLPKGVLSILCGDALEIGKELTSNPKVSKISFTGSSEVGKILMSQSASTLKRLSLELGGNAPFIVFDDANIDEAAEGAILSKYRNCGQTCVCANRIYVQQAVYEEFSQKFTKKAAALKIGAGIDPETSLGPLIDEDAVLKVEEHISDALAKGGKLLLGGKRHKLGGSFFETTVIGQANAKMKVAKEETFGPLAPIFPFKDVTEAINLANNTEYGLAAYFYANNLKRVWQVAEALEYGQVGVNTGLISAVEAPFGGIKESGFGREGSKYGVDDYCYTKYVCMAGL